MKRSDLPFRFRVDVCDLALSPRLTQGDVLEMQTELKPAAGDIALLCDANGNPMLRMLQERTPGRFLAVAANNDFAPLDIEQDQLTVLAIACAEIRVLRRE